jgi:hypothetical protein
LVSREEENKKKKMRSKKIQKGPILSRERQREIRNNEQKGENNRQTYTRYKR